MASATVELFDNASRSTSGFFSAQSFAICLDRPAGFENSLCTFSSPLIRTIQLWAFEVTNWANDGHFPGFHGGMATETVKLP